MRPVHTTFTATYLGMAMLVIGCYLTPLLALLRRLIQEQQFMCGVLLQLAQGCIVFQKRTVLAGEKAARVVGRGEVCVCDAELAE